MVKVLILQEILMPYRIPIYKILAQKYDLTIGCFKIHKNTQIDNIKVIQLEEYKIGKLSIAKGLSRITPQYDVVISLVHFHILNYCALFLKKEKYKKISWTIGVRASYNKNYSLEPEHSLYFVFLKEILKKADANIFYTKGPISLWEKEGIDRKKMFVAQNTVEIFNCPDTDKKEIKSILFIGTLYKQKKTDELIDAYLKVCETKTNYYDLDIIGDGDDLARLKGKYDNPKIHFWGSIYKEKDLYEFFKKAIVCVSPGQAGLSVLKSMGYGVPYVTRKNAITGGEILNITNEENGFIYSTEDDLVRILDDLDKNKNKYLIAGEKAKDYYNKNATPSIMAQGIIDAIEYVMN